MYIGHVTNIMSHSYGKEGNIKILEISPSLLNGV